jgi:hypothetical protein
VAAFKTSPTRWKPKAVAESEAGVEAFIADTAPLIGPPYTDPVLVHALLDEWKLIFPRNPAYTSKLLKVE